MKDICIRGSHSYLSGCTEVHCGIYIIDIQIINQGVIRDRNMTFTLPVKNFEKGTTVVCSLESDKVFLTHKL